MSSAGKVRKVFAVVCSPGWSECLTGESEDRAQEPEPDRTSQDSHHPLPSARQHEESERQQVQEVAVPDRPPSPIPVVRNQPDEEHIARPQGQETKPARDTPSSPPEKKHHSQRHRRKIRQHSPKTAHPEIAEIPHERRPKLLHRPRRSRLHRFLPLILSSHQRSYVLRRHPDPARLERRLRRLVGKLRIKRLPLPALVVQLSRKRPVQSEESHRRRRQHQTPFHRHQEPSAPLRHQRLQQQRSREKHVRRLRIDRHPQKHRRPQRPPSGPKHQPRRDQGEVEHLRRQPPHVQRPHPAHEKPQHHDQGRPLPYPAPPQLPVPEPHPKPETHRIQPQQPARTPQHPHERRPHQRVDQRLRKIQNPRPLLQEEPRGSSRVVLTRSLEVLRLVTEIAVLGQARSHGQVGGAVAPEPSAREARQVDGEGRSKKPEKRGPQRVSCRMPFHSQPASR